MREKVTASVANTVGLEATELYPDMRVRHHRIANVHGWPVRGFILDPRKYSIYNDVIIDQRPMVCNGSTDLYDRIYLINICCCIIKYILCLQIDRGLS